MDSRIDDWQEGPGLVDSMRRYWWLVASITLLAAVAASVWSFTQPVLYQGVVRLYLDTSANQTDPGRIIQTQSNFLTSPEVLDRALALDGNRMSRTELERRLTVEPAGNADVITIKVLDATRVQAGALAESVARAYRESVDRQSVGAARLAVAALVQRQEQLADEIDTLHAQLRADPGNQRLLAIQRAKQVQLAKVSSQMESVRDRASRPAPLLWPSSLIESPTVPKDPVQPKPLRSAILGAFAGLVVSAGLAWWLNGRGAQNRRLPEPRAAGRIDARTEPTTKPEPTARPEPSDKPELAADGAHPGSSTTTLSAATGDSEASPRPGGWDQRDGGVPLTPRELEVLALLRHGLANKQIARRLGISERTVKAHLTSVFSHLGVKDRRQASLWADRHGL